MRHVQSYSLFRPVLLAFSDTRSASWETWPDVMPVATGISSQWKWPTQTQRRGATKAPPHLSSCPPEPAVPFEAHDAKEQIRQAVDIVDIAGGYFQLRREGRLFKALCPWHDDARPSLQINPERQSYRCWVCDIGGDVFSLVMRMEGVTFPEAMNMLADRAGVIIAPNAGANPEKARQKQSLYAVLSWAAEQYHRCLLRAPEAEKARDYLADRGISADSIAKFNLGYAPESWDWLQQRAKRGGPGLDQLEEAGVIARGRNGDRLYDRFRGRALFTICDLQSRTVGFGGRVLPGENSNNAAKYVNSPETPVFSKHKLLYGLNQARDFISRSRTAVVVEGYTDCLIGHQCGVQNMVAVLGTALGESHIRTLRPYADRIVLVLDGDDAGKRRANEVLPLFLAAQVDLRILTLPGWLGPSHYLLQHCAASSQELRENASDAVEHRFNAVRNNLGGGVHQMQQALEDVLKTMAADATGAGPAMLREAGILSRLAHLTRVPENTLRTRLQELRRGGTSRAAANPGNNNAAAAPAVGEPWEAQLLELTLLCPELFGRFRQVVRSDQFRSASNRALFVLANSLSEAGRLPSFDQLQLATEDDALHSRLTALDDAARDKFGQRTAEELLEIAGQLMHRLSWKETDRDCRQDAAQLQDKNLDSDQAIRILNQILEQQRSRQGLSLPTEG